MLIVEGPDGAGKTTLVTHLCDELGVEVRVRSSTSEHGPVDDLWEWVKADMASDPHWGIYDRHPLISETIYGPILRGEVRLGGEDPNELVEMWHQFHALKPYIIYCLPQLATVRVNVAANHDGDTTHTRGVLRYTDHIYAAYYYRMTRDWASGIEAEHWDYESPIAADHKALIVAKAARHTER